HGKTIADAKGEIARGLENVEYACGLTEHLKGGFSSQVAVGVDVHSFRESLGVVAAITPFNFPIMVPLWMTANGCRRSAEPRTTWWSWPTPTSTSPRMPPSTLATAQRVNAAWRSAWSSQWATSPMNWWPRLS